MQILILIGCIDVGEYVNFPKHRLTVFQIHGPLFLSTQHPIKQQQGIWI